MRRRPNLWGEKGDHSPLNRIPCTLVEVLIFYFKIELPLFNVCPKYLYFIPIRQGRLGTNHEYYSVTDTDFSISFSQLNSTFLFVANYSTFFLNLHYPICLIIPIRDFIYNHYSDMRSALEIFTNIIPDSLE